MLEYFDGWLDSKEDGEIREIAAIDAIEFCDRLKDEVEEMIEYAITHSEIAKGWALAFLNDVNWLEIADHFITDARDRLKD